MDGLLGELGVAQYQELLAVERLEGVDDAQRWEKLFHVLAKGFYAVAVRCSWSTEPLDVGYFLPPQSVRFVDRRQPGRGGQASSVAATKAFLSQVVAAHNARA